MRYKKIISIVLAAAGAAILLFVVDNHLFSAGNDAGTIERNPQGEGVREEERQVRVGELEETITVQAGEQVYSEEELEAAFREAKESIEAIVLGENTSPDEVRSDLNLTEQIEDTGIHVSWEISDYEIIDESGVIHAENLEEEGAVVQLKALLTYGEEKEEYVFSVHVYPPVQSTAEKLLERLEKEIEKADEATGESGTLILPDVIDGQPVVWEYVRNFRAAGLLFIGIVLALFIYASDRQKEKEEKEKKERQMELDYPHLVSTFTLFLNAGMTPRNAWYRMAGDYEKNRIETGRREVYEEMLRTMYEIKGGGSEGECYEHFGERCGSASYKKFGAVLSQNLKKGAKGLTVLLKQEADNSFEERKSMAKRLGDEAGTKMLLPMFLMLSAVLLMIVVPAFLSMQL